MPARVLMSGGLWRVSGFRPTLAIERHAILPLLRFGASTSIGSAGDMLTQSVESFLISRYLGSAELGLPPAPSERLQVSVDGAMVPLVHQAWAEVKTLAIGTVGTREGKAGPQPHTQAHTQTAAHWSYEGDAGPRHWGELDADYSACRTGKRQSPIDLHGGDIRRWIDESFHCRA